MGIQKKLKKTAKLVEKLGKGLDKLGRPLAHGSGVGLEYEAAREAAKAVRKAIKKKAA